MRKVYLPIILFFCTDVCIKHLQKGVSVLYNQNIRFGKLYSIAIYNFDVNDLKYINDHYGHEYGDKLIIND